MLRRLLVLLALAAVASGVVVWKADLFPVTATLPELPVRARPDNFGFAHRPAALPAAGAVGQCRGEA